jgi:hypothetical protein
MFLPSVYPLLATASTCPASLFGVSAKPLRLVTAGARNGGLAVQYKPYLADLHRAADAVGEAWAGTHALRHNYIRAFLVEAAGAGLGSDAMMRKKGCYAYIMKKAS